MFAILNIFIGYKSIQATSNTSKYFRIHIVANSDSISDQLLKYTIASKINNYISKIVPENASKEQVRSNIQENIQEILNICQEEINKNNLDYDVCAYIGKMFYDEKQKDDIHFSSGIYDSLKIVIGEGKGQNWWALVYPNALDGVAIDKKTDDTYHTCTYDIVSSENIEIKFGIFELISSLFN